MTEPDRDKAKTFPPLADLLLDFENRIAAKGLPFYAFELLRSWERSAELWAQGRTTPGEIVTWAKPGQSWHNYGLAADYVLDGCITKPGMQWSWNLKSDANADGRNDWLQMAEIAVACGLEAGWFWPEKKCDPPHIQHRFGLRIDEARTFYLQGGNALVWEHAREWLENVTWP